MNIPWDEITTAFRYADTAYNSQSVLKSDFGDNITIIDPLLKGVGDAAYVVNEGSRTVVVFPGSNDAKDWLLNFLFKKGKEREVHEGFRHDLSRMGDDILKAVKENGHKSLLITGHSRGGALADMFLELYYSRLMCRVDCITFAQPKIATNKFYQGGCVKELPGVRYLRVYTANDIVPDAPPSRFDYVHHGESMRLGKELSWRQKIVRLWNLWRNGEKLALISIQDHLPETYRKYLQ
jgi:hypothetical protein